MAQGNSVLCLYCEGKQDALGRLSLLHLLLQPATNFSPTTSVSGEAGVEWKITLEVVYPRATNAN